MAGFSDEEFVGMTDAVWEHVNLPNLVDHIVRPGRGPTSCWRRATTTARRVELRG
jgi:hypothetical protein